MSGYSSLRYGTTFPFLYYWRAFMGWKREAAPGVDGMTWKDHETGLDK